MIFGDAKATITALVDRFKGLRLSNRTLAKGRQATPLRRAFFFVCVAGAEQRGMAAGGGAVLAWRDGFAVALVVVWRCNWVRHGVWKGRG